MIPWSSATSTLRRRARGASSMLSRGFRSLRNPKWTTKQISLPRLRRVRRRFGGYPGSVSAPKVEDSTVTSKVAGPPSGASAEPLPRSLPQSQSLQPSTEDSVAASTPLFVKINVASDASRPAMYVLYEKVTLPDEAKMQQAREATFVAAAAAAAAADAAADAAATDTSAVKVGG